MMNALIRRPVAVSLLMLGIMLAGLLGFRLMPVAPLPQVEFPTISVTAGLPGASPEVVAATVSAPLERALGAIAGVTEMSSSSSQGRSRITLQFDLNRSIDAAARDVQGAINAVVPQLPAGMPALPSWRKVNPAEAPILIIAVSSEVLDRGQLYDAASTVLAQRLSQVRGVGQVDITGGALPAVRVDVDPQRLTAAGLSLADVRTRIAQSSVLRPLGVLEDESSTWTLSTNDQLRTAAQFRQIVLRQSQDRALRLGDVASVTDSVQDIRHYGEANGNPAIVLVVFKQPGANIIETVDRIRALLPDLGQQVAGTIRLGITLDRTVTIRASLREIERTLVISVALVFVITWLFLRRLRLALIPGLCVPVTLLGTCAFMYLAGYSLDNLSLMALIMATGFVVDDAIVVLENISRQHDRGMSLVQAAASGARQIAPTVLSISLALVAVFVPVLFMGGITGRLFQPFALILCVSVLLSMAVSLVLTPVMFARLPADALQVKPAAYGSVYRRLHRLYRRSLLKVLRYPVLMLVFLGAVVAVNVVLYRDLPKGLFPQQDTGRISGNIQGDQSASFLFMQQKLKTVLDVLRQDPAVAAVSGFTGGGQRNYGSLFMALKPLSERGEPAEAVVARLRGKLSRLSGVRVFLTPQQDLRIGARQSSSQFEYTLRSDNLELLQSLEQPVRMALQGLPQLTDVNSDQQNKALQMRIDWDRTALASHGLTVAAADNHLNDAFGQRLVGTIYNPLNQYRVVLGLSAPYAAGPDGLDAVYLPSADGGLVPLAAVSQHQLDNAPISVSHDAGGASLTFSFALPPGVVIAQAMAAVRQAISDLNLPLEVAGEFQGAAKASADGERSQLMLVGFTLLAVYLILGMLYESFLHPLTLLSTLPAAALGALLALRWWGMEFTVIALIAVILLMGIVMKNAILMIDFALQRQRSAAAPIAHAILSAASARLRPILMTGIVALLAALPLAISQGDGAELRQPLGIALVGGLLVSQLFTLYTTPVIYLVLERLRQRVMPRAVSAVALAGAAALGGCAQVPPVNLPQVPAAQTAFRNAPPDWMVAQEAAALPAHWWTVWGDSQLNLLHETVARENASLQASAAQVRVAQSAFEASRAALFPSFSVNAGVLRNANNLTSPPGTVYSASGVFSPWELDLWGRVAATTGAAQSNLQAAAYRDAAARLSLHSQVNQTWLTLGYAQAQQALLQRNEAIAQRLLGLAESRYAAGVTSALEAEQARAQLNNIQAQRVAAQAQQRQLHNALVTLTGGRPLDELLPALTDPPAVPPLLPSSLVARRPDIQAAAASVNAAWAQQEAARTALFPVLNLSASGGYRARGFNNFLDMPTTVWSIGPQLIFPVFDGGLRQANRRQAQAQFEAQTATWRQTVLDALQEVEDQLVAVEQFRSQRQLQKAALEASNRALLIMRNQYEAGLVGLQNLLLAQQTALAAEQALLLAQHQERLALNVLFKNLAGPP